MSHRAEYEMRSWPFAGHRVLLAADRLHLLNAPAASILEHWLDGGSTRRCAERLVARFGISAEQARADVETTLRLWQEQNPAAGAQRQLPPFPPPADPKVAQAMPWPRDGVRAAYRLAGAPWQLRCTAPSLAPAVFDAVAHLQEERTQPIAPGATFSIDETSAGLRLWRGSREVASNLPADMALPTLLLELGEWCYRERDWRVVLHAAGVHNGHQALLLPALGGTGKTTLTAVLLAAGFGYLSDDFVPLIGEDLAALPAPLPLRIRPGAVSLLVDEYPELRELPPCGAADQALRLLPPRGFRLSQDGRLYPVTALVFPERQRDFMPSCQLQPLSPIAALQGLLASNALFHRPLIARHIAGILAWLSRVPAYRLRYRELRPAVACLRGWLT